MNTVYPERCKFFAHKFVRLLHKAAVASEIGRDAFSLLVVIVHTEDAMRYRGAAKFWNSQLVETLGFKKWDQFDACRKRAIESGWLVYTCHGKRMAGEYWVTVPAGYEMVSDDPIELSPEKGYDIGYKDGYEQGVIAGMNRVQSGVRTGDEQGEPSIPDPNPVPKPDPIEEQGFCVVASGETQPPYQIIAQQFVTAFGGTLRMTEKRRAAIKSRWRDDWWRDNWQAALEHGCQSAFLTGQNDRGWKINFDFFLRPDSVTNILEGKYDGQQRAQLTANQQREQNTASAFDRIRAAAAAQGYLDCGGDVNSGNGVAGTIGIREANC